MQRNHETVDRQERGTGRDPRLARSGWGLLWAIALAAAASMAACGGDGVERASTERSEAADLGSVAAAPAEREGYDAVPASATRPTAESVAEPETVPTEPEPPTNVSYEDAENVFRSGDYEESVELFGVYTSNEPDNPWGHYMLGLSAWRSADLERAESALQRTIEVDPSHVKGLVNLARVLLDGDKASDALEYAERAVDLRPQAAESWRVLGNVRAELGRSDEAVEAYREALTIDHGDAWTMNNLGLLMIRDGRYEEALPPLARATTLRPEVAIFQNNLGLALERAGHLAEAVDAFNAALEADSLHEKARVSLGRVEPRVDVTTAEPLDLAALADAFEGDVMRWTEEGTVDDVEDAADAVERQDSTSAEDPLRMPDPLSGAAPIAEETSGSVKDSVPGRDSVPGSSPDR